ncbi:MAG: alpha/beta fold hydrolase [Pseudomonadales bacterium]
MENETGLGDNATASTILSSLTAEPYSSASTDFEHIALLEEQFIKPLLYEGPIPSKPSEARRANKPSPNTKKNQARDQAIHEALVLAEQKAQSLLDFTESINESLGNESSTKTQSSARENNSEDTNENTHESDQQNAFVSGRGFLETLEVFALQSFMQPKVFVKRYQRLKQETLKILQADSTLKPTREDHRFRDPVWRENPFYRSVLQFYLAWNSEVETWIDELELSEDDQTRCHFILEQLAAAISPSNSPLNPASIKRSFQTGGESRIQGCKRFIEDLIHNHGMPHQTRENTYTLGKNLATTAGAVIYRNEIFELIQYSPLTSQVRQRPLLLIPPQINKYYIFDLSPKNSMVQYLLEQGIQVFVISWRVPSKIHRNWNLDTYIEQLENGIDVIRNITGSPDINLVSACAGGLTSMALLGHLTQTNTPWVHSHSMFVTALRATRKSVIELFLTKKSLQRARAWTQLNGVMEGKKLSRLFTWLRPNELVWNFWVNNYLMGKEPPSLDVLYWDNDSTCLPAGLHGDFLDLFINDVFTHPNRLKVLNQSIDFKKINIDTFLVGGSTDYIMPWQGCYETTQLIGGKCDFILSSDNHIQSILRPPQLAKTEYFFNPELAADPEEWLINAQHHNGSWWPRWATWLTERSANLQIPKKVLGNAQHPPLYPAPGKYVLERA